jgi:hypothetical protein
MTKGVHPAMQPNEPSRSDPLRNPICTEAEHGQLPPTHDAPLAPRDPLQPG